MNLYDRSLALGVTLAEATAGSVDHDLLERGRRVVSLLDAATRTLQQTRELQQAFEFGPAPVDEKALSQAARQLRTGLTKHKAAALQHQPTTKFEDVVRLQVKKANDWARARWKDQFEQWQAVIVRAEADSFFGDDRTRRQVRLQAARLKVLATQHPVADRDAIDAQLGGVGMAGWTDAVTEIGTSLTDTLAALDQHQEAFDPEVRKLLARAAGEGVPLVEMTPELLERLRTAGVIGDLAVRTA